MHALRHSTKQDDQKKSGLGINLKELQAQLNSAHGPATHASAFCIAEQQVINAELRKRLKV